MNKKDRIEFVISQLERLFPNPEIPLNHTDPFSLLVAVALSAQSTDKKVNEISPELMRLAPTPFEMAKLEVAEIKQAIKQIGLANNKAKNLKQMSQQLIDRHGGEVPKSFEALEALAGVGHKTASVVMSQAFGHPAFPVDTHIHRLMWRWGLSNGKSVEQTEKDAKRLFPKELWNKLHLQIIYYGRAYSPARGWSLEKDVITKTVGRKSVLKS